jgi:hypothetical protein
VLTYDTKKNNFGIIRIKMTIIITTNQRTSQPLTEMSTGNIKKNVEYPLNKERKTGDIKRLGGNFHLKMVIRPKHAAFIEIKS